MTSWRDTASPLAQRDLDDLLDAVVPLAEATLGRYGELFPFGATVEPDGSVALAAADPGLGDHPDSNAVLAALYAAASSAPPGRRAVAFVADVRLEGADAIRVELEHAEGVALVVLLPYSRSRLRKTLAFGDPLVSAGEPRVWGNQRP